MSEDYAEAVAKVDALWRQAFKDLWLPAERVDPNEAQVPWPANQGACLPGEPGYRWSEHHRPEAPCYECIEGDEDPRPWCDCQHGETCCGPCRFHAHDPSFHAPKAPEPWRPWVIIVPPGASQKDMDLAVLQASLKGDRGVLVVPNGAVSPEFLAKILSP